MLKSTRIEFMYLFMDWNTFRGSVFINIEHFETALSVPITLSAALVQLFRNKIEKNNSNN